MAINDRNIIQIRKALGQVLQNSATATDATNGVLDLLELAERATAEDTSKVSPPPEIVRVMRIYVFEGERKVVEEQLARSLGDGTKIFGPKSTKIHVATIGAFPEVMGLGLDR